MKGNHVTVVFGSDQIKKLNNEQALTEEEVKQFVKTYSFKTLAELKAFILGIEEAQGWLEIIYFEGVTVAPNASSVSALGIVTETPQRSE